MEKNPRYYSAIRAQVKDRSHATIKQIDKDIERTFPNDKGFDKVQLRNILEAYATRNPNVGYCQGINFIVAVLLKCGFSEEESFWMFNQIIENYIPTSYYNSMFGVILDQKVFDHLLRVKQTKIIRHLEKIGLESSIINIQWFICLFCFSFNIEIVKSLWDMIFIQGFQIVFCIGLAIISIVKKKLFKIDDFVEALSRVESECKAISDPAQIKKSMKKESAIVPFGFINRLRQVYEQEVLEEYYERFDRLLPNDYLFSSLSYKCIDENECKQKILATNSFFTFGRNEISLNENYLIDATYPKFAIPGQNLIRTLSGKKNHCCRFESELKEINDVAPEESLRKTILISSTKKTFAHISTFVNINDYAREDGNN